MIVLCIFVIYLSSCAFIQVDPDTQMFVDEHNRQIMFHGVNAVYKTFPFYPEYKVYDTNVSLTEDDARNLRNWGFNMVRLYVAWEGVEIGPGHYNDTYLNEIQQIIQILKKHGIYTLLDCHQDVFSRFYCGEGIPDFYAKQLHPSMSFPKPIPVDIHFDPKTHYPYLSDCLKKGFSLYYPSEAVSSGFQELYTKGSFLYTAFMDFWSHVSYFFKDEEFVLGYELINEPWAGNIYKDPLLLLEPGKSDRVNLAPMYKDLFERIDEHDHNHMVFFEPAVVEIGNVGFEKCPFESKGRCVFSYHVYCGIVDKKGAPDYRIVCDLIDDFFVDLRTKDWKKMGDVGVFVTEFGALYNDSKSITEIHFLVNQLEKRLTSWSYWQFKYFNDYTTADKPATVESFYDDYGNLQTEKVKALSRTFAFKTCGRAVSNQFDAGTGIWEYSFIYSSSSGRSNTQKDFPTMVYLNEEWYYPNGYNIVMDPVGSLNVTSTEKNFLQLRTNVWVKEGQLISVSISPK